MSFYFKNYSTGDLELIKKQLNCKEVFICGIYKKCKYGFPQIILLNPVKQIQGEEYFNYEAVSNVMWLTCPYLNKNIHELENVSCIKKIKTIIQNSVYYTNMMLRAHAEYYYLRNFIFQKYVCSDLSNQGHEVDLSKTGIGGMRDLSAIKCLHLHYCHYNLCKDNIAGLITFKLLNKKTDCDDAYCMCYK